MEKAIVILTGTPSGKVKFDKIITQECWRWNVSAKNWLAEVATTKLYWKGAEEGERNEEYHKTLANFYAFVNQYFGYETHYVREAIERFRADDVEQRSNQGKVFSKFLLVLHGISKELTQKLKEEEGAIQIHITSRSLNTNVEHHDLVYYEDDAEFEEQVRHIVNVLTNTKEKESV
jgi:hypothetical protein